MTNAIANVTLPGGLWIDEDRHQSVDARALTGADEEYLRDLDARLPTARWTTELLARCISRIGPLSPVPFDKFSELTVGDREALLLHVRRLTFGEQMQCLLDCPTCSERLDLDLTTGQLLVAPYTAAQPCYETICRRGETHYKIVYRLPQGSDQEAVTRLAMTDQQQAADVMLGRCTKVSGEDGQLLHEIPQELKGDIAELFATHDPQAELRLTLDCAGCHRPISALLDAASFLFSDLGMRVRDLYREIHLLALHYHWSEREILAMTAPKRHRYLNLIADSMARSGA